MRVRERPLAETLNAELVEFDAQKRSLPGIISGAARSSLIEQLVESIRRVRYVAVVASQNLSPLRMDPTSDLFDPIKAAILKRRAGQVDEAFWLVFLFVHFRKNSETGWRLVRDVYGALGSGLWDWHHTSSNAGEFREWLAANFVALRGGDGVRRKFGNHRKYETLDPQSPNWTGAVVDSYVHWVGAPRTHLELIHSIQDLAGSDPRALFQAMYESMDQVIRFGRTARFDYLTMLGKIGLAPIEPGSAYMEGATGPLKGARLLFGGTTTAPLSKSVLDQWLRELAEATSLGMNAMQVLEDALCNWQKSPTEFRAFRG